MRTTTVRTGMTTRGWPAMLLAVMLALAGCGGGDLLDTGVEAGGGSDTVESDSGSSGDDRSDGVDDGPSPSGGAVIFGGETIAMQPLRCFFQEQPRAGLGGVFTHSAQARGMNAAGEAVLLDMTRAIAEDGTVEFDLSFGVGDPFGSDYVAYYGTGQEVLFGDNSVSANGDVNDFESGPVTLTFDLSCS